MLRLKEIRKQHGLTQTELGNMIGVTKSTMSLYESGYHEPDLETIKKLADILHVSVDFLLGRETDDDVYHIQTDEARILAPGIDKLPKEQREQALNVVRAMFAQYSDYFDKESAK